MYIIKNGQIDDDASNLCCTSVQIFYEVGCVSNIPLKMSSVIPVVLSQESHLLGCLFG